MHGVGPNFSFHRNICNYIRFSKSSVMTFTTFIIKITINNQPIPSGESLSEVKSLSRVRLFATPWTAAHQTPLSMGFSRQEYWSGLPFPSPGDLPDPGIKPRSPTLQADALTSEAPGKPKRVFKGTPNSLLKCAVAGTIVQKTGSPQAATMTHRDTAGYQK